MKFEGTRKSKADGFTDVYTFTFSKEEMQIIYDLVEDARNKTPKLFETSKLRARMKSIVICLFGVLININK